MKIVQPVAVLSLAIVLGLGGAHIASAHGGHGGGAHGGGHSGQHGGAWLRVMAVALTRMTLWLRQSGLSG